MSNLVDANMIWGDEKGFEHDISSAITPPHARKVVTSSSTVNDFTEESTIAANMPYK